MTSASSHERPDIVSLRWVSATLWRRRWSRILLDVSNGTETTVPARRRRDRSASISGPSAETALQAAARALMRLVYRTQGARTRSCTGSITMFVVLSCADRMQAPGGQEDATEHDTDQNLACRPAAASKRLGGHPGAACQRRDNGPRGDRRAGDTRHRRDGQPAGRNWYRLRWRRRVLDGPQFRPLHRAFHWR